MNNHMILFANEMSILQTLKDCNYIDIHKSIQKQPQKELSLLFYTKFKKQINYSYPAPKYTSPDNYYRKTPRTGPGLMQEPVADWPWVDRVLCTKVVLFVRYSLMHKSIL